MTPKGAIALELESIELESIGLQKILGDDSNQGLPFL